MNDLAFAEFEGPTLREIGEFGLIQRIRTWCGGTEAAPGVQVGIGDDAAVLTPSPGSDLVVTTDVQVAGRHFLPAWLPPDGIGRRAAAVNQSDMAAMGACPRWAFVSLGLPARMPLAYVEALYAGLLAAIGEPRAGLPPCVVAGGNLSATGDEWFIDVTMLGEVEPGFAIRRAGAAAGDQLLATGDPGAAARGLARLRALEAGPEFTGGPIQRTAALTRWGKAHPEGIAEVRAFLAPRARLEAGRLLRALGATAAIDVSDGLRADAGHLAAASGCSVHFTAPVPAGPSDDYELLFTVPAGRSAEAERVIRERTGVPVRGIGVLLPGFPQDEPGRGFDHFG